MKIAPPNYTQSPNVFYDEIFKTLTEGELRIVLVLIRQTFGWHKQADRISLGQLAEKTGMLKGSVCRSLNSLIKKNVIEKKKFGESGKERCYYSLVVEEQEQELISEDDGIETEEEKRLISNNLDQSPKETPPVSQRDYPQSPKETHKTNPTKENEQQNRQTYYQDPSPSVPVCPSDKSVSLSLSEADEKANKKKQAFSWFLKIGCDVLSATQFSENFPSEDIEKASVYVKKQIEIKKAKGETIKNIVGYMRKTLEGRYWEQKK